MTYQQGRAAILFTSLLLVISLCLNVFLWWQLHSPPKLVTIPENSATLPEDDLTTLSPTLRSEIQLTAPNTALQVPEEQLSIEQLYRYLREENWPVLTVTVRSFLRQNPDNIEAQLIEAELIARTEPLAIALVHYYSLLDLGLDSEQRKIINQKIEQLFENATEQLRFDRSWDLLAELLEPLVQIAPDERRYLILLAEAYAQQSNAVMMENALAGLQSDDPAIQSIRGILARNLESDSNTDDAEIAQENDFASNLNQQNLTRIPLARLGNQYTVETGIDGRPIRLMIDTGASTTAITTSAWSRLSGRVASQFIGVFKVNTAAGFIEAPMFKVKSFTMGSLSFDDISVMIIPSRMMGDDPRLSPQGLLGMNILSNYNFQIDQQAAQLLLSPRT